MRDGLYLVLVGLAVLLAASPFVYGYVYTSVMHGGSVDYGGMMASGGDHCGMDDSDHVEDCEYMMSDHGEECESMMAEYGSSEHIEECESMMNYHMNEYSEYGEDSGMGCH